MTETKLSPDTEAGLREVRAAGGRVIGPGPVTPGETAPTADARITLPGMHVQIALGSRFVEGIGASADEAVRDALDKLAGYEATGRTGES
jgi:hypothetical protein